MNQEKPDEGRDVGPAVVGTVGIAILVIAAVLVGAVPYAASLLGVAVLPFPGGLVDLSPSDVAVRAVGAFLVFALAGIPADLVGKTVTIWVGLRSRPCRGADPLRARRAGRLTAQALKGSALAVVLAVGVTASVTGAVVVAILTTTLEHLLEPIVDRYSKARPS